MMRAHLDQKSKVQGCGTIEALIQRKLTSAAVHPDIALGVSIAFANQGSSQT